MNRRLLLSLAAAALALTACSGGDTVPDDQAIKPADKAPSGWEKAEVGPVTLAVAPTWEEQPPASQEGIESTAWRGPEDDDGIATGGVEVRLVPSPQQDVEKAAESLAISAMAGLGAGRVEPEPVTWPNAEQAFLLEYDSTIRMRPATAQDPTPPPLDEPVTFVTRTLVLSLADGSQVQVTALSPQAAEAEQAIASVVLAQTDDS